MRNLRIVHPDPEPRVVHRLPAPSGEPYLSVSETARALRVSETTVRRYIRDHGDHLTVAREGRRIRVAVSSIPVFDRIKTLRRRQRTQDINGALAGTGEPGQALAVAVPAGVPATVTGDTSAALLAEMSREIIELRQEAHENNAVMRRSMVSLVFMINKCNNDIRALASTDKTTKREHDDLIERLEDAIARMPQPAAQGNGTAATSLREHLAREINALFADATEHMIASALLEMVDDSGYLGGDLGATAARLGVTGAAVEAVLATLQTLDPPGMFARDLAECLTVQLHRRGRLDPAMRALINNLDLLADQDVTSLKRLCGVDDKKLVEMIAEIRALNSKPGTAFKPFAAPMVRSTELVGAGNQVRELYADGRYLQALPFAQKELEQAEQDFGRDHPTTALIMGNLAMIYEALDRFSAAEPLYTRAADIYMNALGPNHPDAAASLMKCATLMRKMGRRVEAAEMQARAESLRKDSP